MREPILPEKLISHRPSRGVSHASTRRETESAPARVSCVSGHPADRVPFRFDLYHQNDDTRLYFSVPGQFRYRPVEDIDLDNSAIGVELSSPRTRFEGELAGSGLKFYGKFKGLSGALELGFDK
ncbi:MAG: hypothetical protein ACYC9O_14255 [Candidatus Latescibacterota bacterium]